MVIQNRLHHLLPKKAAFLASSVRASSAVTSIPLIAGLAEPLRTEVRLAFSDACRMVWIVLLPFAAVGLLTCVGLRAFELNEETDADYALVAVG